MSLSVRRVLTHERVLTQGYVAEQQDTLSLPAPRLSVLLLIMVVLLSSISVVYLKDYNRRLFVDYQRLHKEHVALQVASSKLLLEQGLIASRPHVQEIAEQELNMQMPTAKDVVMVRA